MTQHSHAYIGLIKCGGRILDSQGDETDEVCGCSVTGEEKRKTLAGGEVKLYYYWHCSSTRLCSQRNKAFMTKHGLSPNLSELQIEEILGKIFKPLKFTPDVCSWMQDVLLREHHQKSADHKQQVQALKRGYEMLQSYIPYP